MFSLQRLFGRPDQFFGLLDQSVAEACACARSLKVVLADPESSANLHDLRASRQRNKQALDKVGELVVTTFVTALDREDIEAIAAALYKIPKPIEKFAERYLITFKSIPEFRFDRQADIIEKVTLNVKEMLQLLESGANIEKVRALNSQLQIAEAEADALMNSLIHDLFTKHVDALKVVILRDLYDLLERVVDRCRDAGNVISHVCLKYS